ncbi:MAG: dependent epimerase/dehydratase [Bacillales bacterium]|jgi:uncharacterized protein (TIGR01777 family)|nr:dependent epimerase/dehydratase [Bacillales bacterium]
MNILLFGGTGLIGSSTTNFLSKQGFKIYIVTRNNDLLTKSNDRIIYLDFLDVNNYLKENNINISYVINLAGSTINTYWSKEAKEEIIESRLKVTRVVKSIISNLENKPKCYLQASAIGIYGTSSTDTFTEASETTTNDFLSYTSTKWEQAGLEIEQLGIRSIYARFGVVLSHKGGALPKIINPIKYFFGGNIGSGHQYISWIHITDVIRLIEFCLLTENINGPVNFTAPNPVTMKRLGTTCADLLNRPFIMKVPSRFLQLFLGERSILILKGQKVLPEKALKHNFTFTYTNIKLALQQILSQRG